MVSGTMFRRLLRCVAVCGAIAAVSAGADSPSRATDGAVVLQASFDGPVSDPAAPEGLRVTVQGKHAEPRSARSLKLVPGVSRQAVQISPDTKNASSLLYDRLSYDLTGCGLGDEGTVAFWCRLDSPAAVGELFRLDWDGDWRKRVSHVSFSEWNQLCAEQLNSMGEAGKTIIRGRGGVELGKWWHLAYAWKGGERRIFINGYEAKYERNTSVQTPLETPRYLRFAGALGVSIDELKVFDKALSDSEVRMIMSFAPPAATAVIPAAAAPSGVVFRSPLNGRLDATGPDGEIPGNMADVSFVTAVKGKGALMIRHGYDRRAVLNFGPVDGLLGSAVTLGFFLVPRWSGDDGAVHGLLAAKGDSAEWRVYKNGTDKLIFELRAGGAVAAVEGSAASFKKDLPLYVEAAYCLADRKLSLGLDGKEVASAPLPEAFPAVGGGKALLVVGDLPGMDNYSKTLAEGVIDDIRVHNRLLPFNEIADAAKHELEASNDTQAAIRSESVKVFERPLWDLAGACRETSPTRERICLNALWRFQLTETDQRPKPESWSHLAVPGRYAGQENGCADSAFQLRDDQLKPVPFKNGSLVWGGKLGHDFRNAWFERSFKADPSWKDKSVLLRFDELSPTGTGEVFLNGERIGALEDGVSYELELDPARLRMTDDNFLLVHVSDSGNRWAWRGIKGDVWLEILPKVRLGVVKIEPSIRSRRLTVKAEAINGTNGSVKAVLRCAIAGERAPEAFEGKMVEIPANGKAELVVETSWKTARLWDINDPYLYACAPSLVDGGGAVIDERPPITFGFREFWIDGADFILNGVKIHLRSDDWWYGPSSDLTWCRRWVKEIKSLGYNSVRSPFDFKDHVYDNVLTACDEAGVLVFIEAGGVTGGSFATWGNPETKERVERRMRGVVERWGNRPSIVMWYLSTNFLGYGWDYHPLKIADGYRPTTAAEKVTACEEGAEMLRKLDPTRIFFFQAGGCFGPIHTSNGYFGWWPLAEQMEWPEEWSRRRPKPLFMVETSFPYQEDWLGMDLSHGKPTPYLLPENAARFLGQKAYEWVEESSLPLLSPPAGKLSWSVLAEQRAGTKDAWMVKKELLEKVIPAWRGADISGFIPFAELGFAYFRKAKEKNYFSIFEQPANPVEFRTPGWKSDVVRWSYQADADPDKPLTPVGMALKKVLAPALVFVAGEKKRPTSQDHVYAPGQRVAKSIMLINDFRKAQRFDLTWTVTGPNGEQLAGPERETVEVEAAGVERVSLSFKAPELSVPGTCSINIEVREPAGVSADPYVIKVIPVAAPPQVERPLIVHDPKGLTSEALEKRGMRYQNLGDVTSIGEALLIVGREGMDEAFFNEARRIGLAKRVADGDVDLVIFEQKDLRALGLAVNEVYCRDVFAAGDASSPLLAGVTPEDLSWPRGDGTLAEAYPPPAPSTESSVRSPFWHWSNRNMACSFPVRRPSAGACRVHLAAGMDLLYAPLLEIGAGKGRMLFCQYELSHRIGVDPASTRLFDNIIAHYAKKAERHLKPVIHLGGDSSAAELLRRLGFDAVAADSPEKLGAESTVLVDLHDAQLRKAKPALEAGAAAGATVLLVNASKEDLAEVFALKPVEIKRLNVFKTLPAGESWWGALGSRDRFFRYGHPVCGVEGQGVVPLTDPPVAARIASEKGAACFIQLDPRLYDPLMKEAAILGKTTSHLWALAIQQDRAARLWCDALAAAGCQPSDELARRLEQPLLEWRQDLTGEWRFAVDPEEKGDGEKWFTADFDDSAWRTLTVSGYWEEQGIRQVNPTHPSDPKWHKDYDGLAWYRKTFRVAPDLIGKELFFSAPKGIDDFDTVYVNGVEIGRTDKETPGWWSAPRLYPLPAELVKTGKAVVTVRVFDDKGNGGIPSDTVELRTKPVAHSPFPYFEQVMPEYDTETHIRW